MVEFYLGMEGMIMNRKDEEMCESCLVLPICCHKDPLSLVEKCNEISIIWIKHFRLWKHSTFKYFFSEPLNKVLAVQLAVDTFKRNSLLISEIPKKVFISRREYTNDTITIRRKYPLYIYYFNKKNNRLIEDIINGTML